MSQDEVEEVLDADLSEVPVDQYRAETGAYDSQATYEFQGAATAEANSILKALKPKNRSTNNSDDKETVKTSHGEVPVQDHVETSSYDESDDIGGIGL